MIITVQALKTLMTFLATLWPTHYYIEVRSKSQHLIEHFVTRSSALVPRRIEYVPVIEYVDRPVPVQAELTNSELVHALWTNMVWKQLVPSLWELVAIDFIYIAVITAAIIISVVTICRCTRGRPIQTTPNWLIQIFNNTKGRDHAKGDSSSRRGESCGGPSAGHSTHEESDPVQHAIEPDIKLDNFRPGDDNEWTHLYAARHAKQRWAALYSLDMQCLLHGQISSREGYEQLLELKSAFGVIEKRQAVNSLFDAIDPLDKSQSRHRNDNESAIEHLAVHEKLADATQESMSNSEKEAHIKALFHNSLNNLREVLIRAIINHQDLLKPGQPGYNIVFAKSKPIVHQFEWLLPHLSSSDDTNTSARQHARSWQGNNNKKQQKKTSASPQGQQEQQAKVEEFIEKCARWTRPVHQQQQQHQQHHPTRPASTEQHPPQLHHKQQHQLQQQQFRQQLHQQTPTSTLTGINQINSNASGLKKPIFGRCLVEGSEVTYELDSGASTTVNSTESYRQLGISMPLTVVIQPFASAKGK